MARSASTAVVVEADRTTGRATADHPRPSAPSRSARPMPPAPGRPAPPVPAARGRRWTDRLGQVRPRHGARARLPAEVLVADSRQVYRGMEIGTAKPSCRAGARAPPPPRPGDPRRALHRRRMGRARPRGVVLVAAHGTRPLLVGGTGLYVTALVGRLDFVRRLLAGDRDELAAALAEGLATLAGSLGPARPAIAARTDLRNPRRVVRALERAEAGGAGERPRWTLPRPGRAARHHPPSRGPRIDGSTRARRPSSRVALVEMRGCSSGLLARPGAA